MFESFLKEGFNHVFDINGLDHVVFLAVIASQFKLKEWKKVLTISLGFTFAHSIALALAFFNIVTFSPNWIEILISLSILFVSIENLFYKIDYRYKLISTTFFGIIHGLGFSRLLISLFQGLEFNLTETLLPFNLGIELAQIILMLFVISLMTIASNLKISKIICIIGIIISLIWTYERIINLSVF